MRGCVCSVSVINLHRLSAMAGIEEVFKLPSAEFAQPAVLGDGSESVAVGMAALAVAFVTDKEEIFITSKAALIAAILSLTPSLSLFLFLVAFIYELFGLD